MYPNVSGRMKEDKTSKLTKSDKVFITVVILTSTVIVVGGVAYIVYKKPDTLSKIGYQLSGNLKGAFSLGKAAGRREVFNAFRNINLSDPRIISAIKSRSLEKIFEIVSNVV